ncbi:uncharacterized protein LOC142322007 [Lycorma delicatula]|uniref:uncharacterized protein LOC142322007 n=1 Tax=Lycorma delicatula TaxID=130591 RepID=UPI003F510CED
MKVLVIILCLIHIVPVLCQRQQAQTGRLLRIPRIYNALITTDEELIPSQAYPAVAPVLRPAIPHFSVLVYNETEYIPPILPPAPVAAAGRLPSQEQGESPVYTLQAQQRLPDLFDDRVKNNRNPDIPDVPPPPLPVKPQQSGSRPSSNEAPPRRRPQDYPPPPSATIF